MYMIQHFSIRGGIWHLSYVVHQLPRTAEERSTVGDINTTMYEKYVRICEYTNLAIRVPLGRKGLPIPF